ncbi:dimethylaniline monooxygenase [N-oxide-forming] 2-like [Gigantopelta aegis]|uniref:dimethylaniline monooxygenase [N-oxide-forming] 2-like n=1 Tax=Gigantopelta aegis TaxID=1735272 RepID=UPI001B8898F8|nr:dimethylaniline monooxygenase [N-oxide-forming] 2-like [Gigantopelta aegis]
MLYLQVTLPRLLQYMQIRMSLDCGERKFGGGQSSYAPPAIKYIIFLQKINQVHLSVGQGSILLTRFDEHGIPFDMQVFQRKYDYSPKIFVHKLIRKLSNLAINHDAVGLHSERDFPCSPIMINDEIHLQILTGKVKVVGRIAKTAERSVHIDDGTVVDDVDVVVFATGYDRHLPFLDNRLVDSAQAISDQFADFPY